MEKKLSVIIPVYNVEKYLPECLDSVVDQSLQEIELICVNDGSRDGSRNILSEYAEKDNRITILDKPNGGLSSARNAGLAVAEGRYVLFLDSDDRLSSKDVLDCLYQKAEKEALDQLFFDAAPFFESEDVKKKNSNYIDYYKRKKNYTDTLTGKELFCALQSNWDFKPSACMQILRRSFLRKHELKFYENIIHEDEVFTLECITLAQRSAYINLQGYMRRVRENSIMTVSQKSKGIYGYYSGTQILLDFAQKYIDINDQPFVHFYLQRVEVMMELAARLFYKETEEEKNQIIGGFEEESNFKFAVDMQAWQQMVSLKERAKKIKEYSIQIKAQQEKIEDLETEINKLSESFNKERESLKKELNENKRKLDQIKQSYSFRVGKTVTWVPRKLKKILKKSSD